MRNKKWKKQQLFNLVEDDCLLAAVDVIRILWTDQEEKKRLDYVNNELIITAISIMPIPFVLSSFVLPFVSNARVAHCCVRGMLCLS